MNAADSRELPAAEGSLVRKRQLINNARDKIMPDIEPRPAPASLAIERILRRANFGAGWVDDVGASINIGAVRVMQATAKTT